MEKAHLSMIANREQLITTLKLANWCARDSQSRVDCLSPCLWRFCTAIGNTPLRHFIQKVRKLATCEAITTWSRFDTTLFVKSSRISAIVKEERDQTQLGSNLSRYRERADKRPWERGWAQQSLFPNSRILPLLFLAQSRSTQIYWNLA